MVENFVFSPLERSASLLALEFIPRRNGNEAEDLKNVSNDKA